MIDESLTLTLTPTTGSPRRLQLRPMDHPGATHRLVEKEWTGCVWRPTGSEFVNVELTRARYGLDQPHAADRGP